MSRARAVKRFHWRVHHRAGITSIGGISIAKLLEIHCLTLFRWGEIVATRLNRRVTTNGDRSLRFLDSMRANFSLRTFRRVVLWLIGQNALEGSISFWTGVFILFCDRRRKIKCSALGRFNWDFGNTDCYIKVL